MSMAVFLILVIIAFVFLSGYQHKIILKIKSIFKADIIKKIVHPDEEFKKNVWINIIGGMCVALVVGIAGVVYQKYKEDSARIKVKCNEAACGVGLLNTGEYCLFNEYLDIPPCFVFDIQNNSEKTVYLNVSDAILIDLVEFTSYEEVDFDPAFFISEMIKSGFNIPFVFELNASTELGKQMASPVIDEKAKVMAVEEGYLSIEPNKMQRLVFNLIPEVDGYYRFTISLNYIYNNENYSYQTKEYKIMFGDYLEKKQRKREEKEKEREEKEKEREQKKREKEQQNTKKEPRLIAKN